MNGNNEFHVSFSRILWIEKALNGHSNVTTSVRTNDIYFNVHRKIGPEVRLVCLNDYACGMVRIREVLSAFKQTNFIYVGGSWNGYTKEAKEYCLQEKIGLYNSSEISGALHKYDFYSYCKRDEKGNPIYPFNNA